jgi:CSLREA domain-containing protein
MQPKPTSLGLVAMLIASTLAAPFPGRLAPTSTVIAVTTTADELNNDGFCSLREAIESANLGQPSGAMPGECPASSGDDTINLPAGTYSLTLSSGGLPDTGLSGDLEITSSLTIAGSGAQNTAIDGGGLSRVLEISGRVVVTVTGVTLQHGRPASVDSDYAGAGLYVHAGSVLSLDHSQVVGNYANAAGGIFNEGFVTLTDSRVTGNQGRGSTGGIANAGTMTLTRSLVDGNNTIRTGSAVGGIDNSGTLVVISSTIYFNHASALAGGIANGGTLTMTNSTLTGNGAGSAGGLHNYGIAMVSASTISENYAGGFLGGDGGGVLNEGMLTLINDTISGNSSTSFVEKLGAGKGGGLYSAYGALVLNNVTVVNNTTNADPLAGQGGGIFVDSGAVTITNSLIGQNLALASPVVYSDCSGTLTFAEYDVIQTLTGCTISHTGPGNLVGLDPLVGALQDNGGATLTQALMPGSPAMDAGNPALPGSSEYACAATDQRGVARPAHGRCDIGAYEFAGPIYRLRLPMLWRDP